MPPRQQAVAAVLDRLAKAPTNYTRALNDLEDRSKKLAQHQRHLLDSIKAGIPADLVREEAALLAQELARNDRDLCALNANPPATLQTTAREVEEFLTSFEVVSATGKPAQRKGLVRTFIQRLELDPKKQEARASSCADLLSTKSWCPEGDLNPHGLPHTPLKRTRLPVPPSGHTI